MLNIAIAGDVCATGINERAFADGNAAQIFGDLADTFRAADLAIVNLESPLYAQPCGIRKSGPVLGVPEACVAGLVAGRINVVGLANNHSMDHSWTGLRNTIRVCREHGMATVGAGANLAEARRIHVEHIKGVRIGVLAVAEREFGIAGRSKWGVNPLDPIDFARNVRAHASQLDFLIVLVHGGNEHLHYPRPTLVDTCRFFIEEGADVVLCQHSHCIGCIEQYQDGYIVYGQGNLIFDSPRASSSWREGGVVCIALDADRRFSAEFIPVEQRLGVPGVRRFDQERSQSILNAIDERSRALKDPDLLERYWREFCQSQKDLYLRRLGTHNRFGRGVDRLLRNVQSRYARSWKLRAEQLNLIRCESHREALINILSDGFE